MVTIFQKPELSEKAFEKYVIKLGFESMAEFLHLVAEINLSIDENLEKFLYWRDSDGTKDGLLQITNKTPGTKGAEWKR